MGLLVIVQWDLDRPYDSLPPKDHRQAKTTTELWLEMGRTSLLSNRIEEQMLDTMEPIPKGVAPLA